MTSTITSPPRFRALVLVLLTALPALAQSVTATEPAVDDGDTPVDVLALDEALTAFAAEYERPARIVMLRYFADHSIPQIAELLSVTSRTVDREYLFARTWLRRFLSRE